MVSQNKIWINFKEFKTLSRALSLELNDTSTSNLPFENYTGYLLSHGLYSKFCSLLSRLSHGLCPAYLSSLLQLYQPQRSLRSSCKLLFTVPTVNSATYGTVNVLFLSPHLYYGTIYRILLKTQHLFRLLNLPSKHSCFGNFIFDLFHVELYLAFRSPNF